jgi:hypothetical protein
MKKKMEMIAIAIVGIVVSAVLFLPLTAVGVEPTEISIGDVIAAPGAAETTSIMINVTDPSGLGAATINLTYDPSVCVVTNVVKGPSSFDSLTSSHTLKAVGDPDDSSTLNLNVEVLRNNTGKLISYVVNNGTFTIQADNEPPIVTNPSADPLIIPDDTDNEPRWGELAELKVNVTDESEIASVTVNLSAIGGGSKEPMGDGTGVACMFNIGNYTVGSTLWTVYNYTTNASEGTSGWNETLGTYVPYCLPVNATDIYGKSNTSVCINLTVMNNGDVSSDGETDSWDCTYLARSIAGIPGYTMVDEVADVSGDSEADSWDCTYLARHIAEIPGYDKLK